MKDYWSTIIGENTLYQMGPQSHRVYALDLLSNLSNPVRSLLDIGCGTGPIYQLLKFDSGKQDSKWNVIEKYKGIDPSEAMIQSCKYNFPDGDFEVQNAVSLKEKDNSWDCLLYMHAFDYIYDYMKALQEAYRVTKRYICIILWQPLDKGDSHRLNNNIDGQEQVDWSTARLQHFSWEQLQKEFKEVGFKLLLKKDDVEINKEGKYNTLILLEKI